MFRLPKFVLSYGAVAIAATLLMLAAPRAVHAIAATLVQVTNATANPVITQSVQGQAVRLVELAPEALIPPGTPDLVQPAFVNASGPFTPKYSVPANVSLVITSVDITGTDDNGNPCAKSLPVSMTNGDGNNHGVWMLAPGQGTAHFDYPSGIVFLTGHVPYIYANSGCYAWVQMNGYYTAN